MTHDFRHAAFTFPFSDPTCDQCGVRKSKHAVAMLQDLSDSHRRDYDYGTVVTSDEGVSRLLHMPLSDDPPDPSVKAWITGQSFDAKNPATADVHPVHPLTAASDAAANMLTSASEAMSHPTETHHSAGGGGHGGYDNSGSSHHDSGSSSSYDSSSSSSSDSGSSSSE